MKFRKFIIEEKSVKNVIYDFFKKNSNPHDKSIHNLADKFGIDPDEMEGEIYKVLSSFMANGKFNESGKNESDFSEKEIKMGIEVEQEHTIDLDMAKRIALDHLSEIPDYYTRLKKMEDEAKAEMK